MDILTNDGVRLYAERIGEGEPSVIVPNAVHLQHDFARLANGRCIVFYDLRNRGRSEATESGSIQQDVDDLDDVRRHFGIDRVALIGHSYLGLMVVLYAVKYSAKVSRVVQIGAPPPDPPKKYPSEPDPLLAEISAKIAALPPGESPWPLARQLFVADPANADKIHWPVGVENETAPKLMPYLGTHILPSIRQLALTDDDLANVTMPVLTIHGRLDRHAPYGGAVDWAKRLPNATLLTIENAAHYPWIEAPDEVFGAIDTALRSGADFAK